MKGSIKLYSISFIGQICDDDDDFTSTHMPARGGAICENKPNRSLCLLKHSILEKGRALCNGIQNFLRSDPIRPYNIGSATWMLLDSMRYDHHVIKGNKLLPCRHQTKI